MADNNKNTGNHNTGYWNAGNWNTGNRNTGDWNTGDRNTGDCNAGYWNAGDRNTGDCNEGDRNTGDCNTGYWNAGYWNTGDWNTGNWNAGHWNTGDWNTGDRNAGYCNTVTPEDCLIFNKPAKIYDWDNADKPDWMFIKTMEWIYESSMSDKEKEAYPSYTTTGGYLKVYSNPHHAYIEAWERADDVDRAKTFKLPNFNADVFEEIFGFNPCKDTKKKVTLELTDEQLEKIKEIIE